MKAAYLVTLFYLFIAVPTAYFLGRHLNRHGEHFLRAIFKGRMEIVLPVNNMLLIGFYLVNIGFVLAVLSTQADVSTIQKSIEYLALKIGMVYLVVAVMHYFNLLVFIIIESKITQSDIHQNKK